MVAGRTQQYPRPASAKHSTLWRRLRPESADFSQFICHRNWQLQRLKRGRGNHQYKHGSLDLKVKPGSFCSHLLRGEDARNNSQKSFSNLLYPQASALSLRRVIMDVVNQEYFFLKLARREFEPSSPSIIHKDYWLNLGTCRKIWESIRPTLTFTLTLTPPEATLPKLT